MGVRRFTAGDLDRRIQVRKWVEVGRNGLNEPILEWRDFGPTRPARRQDVSDGERFAAGQWDNQQITRFVIRASAAARQIARSDKLIHEGVTWDIDGIKEVPPGRAFLEITAVTSGDP